MASVLIFDRFLSDGIQYFEWSSQSGVKFGLFTIIKELFIEMNFKNDG